MPLFLLMLLSVSAGGQEPSAGAPAAAAAPEASGTPAAAPEEPPTAVPAEPPAASDEAPAEPRRRLRELGIVIGRRAPGPLNAITDVSGVEVGHVTLVRGEGALDPGSGPVRTGVTAVLPHGGDLWREKVPAAVHVLNGTGEMTGSIWVNTQGALEVPILLTNTMNVGRVMDGVIQYMLQHYPAIGRSDDVVAPTVAECDDSTLNDARGLHVAPEDAVQAIETAAGGRVAEGAVGAGTGMISFGFKSGIGSASRVLEREEGGWTVGVLVNANMGRREELTVAGAPVGRELVELQPIEATDGSLIVVIATDAPLDHLKLERLAARAALGMARTGATSRHGSGDIFLAFSTGNRIPHHPAARTYPMTVVADDHLNPLFEAAQEAVEEAILNSLTMAETTVGRDGNTAFALPLDRLVAALKKHGRALESLPEPRPGAAQAPPAAEGAAPGSSGTPAVKDGPGLEQEAVQQEGGDHRGAEKAPNDAGSEQPQTGP